MELTPNQILDKALRILTSTEPPHSLMDITLEFHDLDTEDQLNHISGVPIQPILDKLWKDGFIDEIGFPGEPSVYSITFEGRVFSENGGYSKEHEIERMEIDRENRNVRYTLIGAWVAAIATAMLVILEVVKIYIALYRIRL